MGAVRETRLRTGFSPDIAQSYTAVARVVREMGLLGRTRIFYSALAFGLVVALVAVGFGIWLLGDSWFQLLMAAALGIIFTQFAFLAHEASHRQILKSGPANDRIGRFLATFVVGMSYAWWMN